MESCGWKALHTPHKNDPDKYMVTYNLKGNAAVEPGTCVFAVAGADSYQDVLQVEDTSKDWVVFAPDGSPSHPVVAWPGLVKEFDGLKKSRAYSKFNQLLYHNHCKVAVITGYHQYRKVTV